MNYIDKETGDILTRQDIQNKFPNSSIPPGDLNNESMKFANVDPIFEVEKPEDNELQIAVLNPTPTKVDGSWKFMYNMVDKYTKEELENIEVKKLNERWQFIRDNRNKMLNEIDVVLKKHEELEKIGITPFDPFYPGVFSNELISDILKYKQELRDIPLKNKYPFNINWPDDPLDKLGKYEYEWSLTIEYKYLADNSLKLWNDLRKLRNEFLEKMDKIIMKHNELKVLGISVFSDETPGVLSDELYLEVLKYKQELRDLPKNVSDPKYVIWPDSPFENFNIIKKEYFLLHPKEQEI